ncbi:MAG: MmgE/PrpD family protein [Actinomycetia bacterium]|nr:MmgE/PrpD family protein [Actinomycetes bacterium]
MEKNHGSDQHERSTAILKRRDRPRRAGITALDDAGTGALIGWGGRTTGAPSAAMLNSSFIQGFELDDYHPLAP